MKAKTSTALLSIVVELTLVHMVMLLVELLSQSRRLFFAFFHFNIISHVLWEEVVIEILLSPL
jgi:hypothetical protein